MENVHTGTVYTGQKKKSITGLQRGEEAGRCREDSAGDASGEKDKGRQAVYSLRYSRQKWRAVRSRIQKRMRVKRATEKWGEMTCERSSLRNMLNNSSSQVARGHPQEQSPR